MNIIGFPHTLTTQDTQNILSFIFKLMLSQNSYVFFNGKLKVVLDF